MESGEIWDRYRTLDVRNPNSGLAYCLFSLRALIFTAHVVDSNSSVHNAHLSPSSPSCSPLLGHIVEAKLETEHSNPATDTHTHTHAYRPRTKSVRASSHTPHTRCMASSEKALLQALHFYGKYYILYPVGTVAQIKYAPYQGQQPLFEDLAEFLIGAAHFPGDHVLKRVVEFNLLAGAGRLTSW